MPRFKATRSIKYRGRIYAAGDEFQADERDAQALKKAFHAEQVANLGPVRRVAETVAPPAPEPTVELAPVDPERAAVLDAPAPRYRTRRLKSDD